MTPLTSPPHAPTTPVAGLGDDASGESLSAVVAIALDKRGGDAWAWEKRLTGTCRGCPPDAALSVEVGGQVFPAERNGAAFAADVRLDPGPNEVVAVATLPDGVRLVSDPVVYDVKLQPRPTARLRARVEDGRIVVDAAGSSPSDYDRSPIVSSMVTARPGNPAPLALRANGPAMFAAEAPTTPGTYVVHLLVEDAAGRSDATKSIVVVEDGRVRTPDPVRERAGWIAPAVVYGVVPRNFDPPGFAGVAGRLDDLHDLGVDALWFSPITRTPEGRFGYEVTDYFDTNPSYGTLAEFRALVDATHARGMRVLMDVVPNHTSDAHPYFADTVAHGESSPYWDFYDRDDGGNPTHYFDWTHLPNLNYDHPEVRRFMLEALTFWVRDVGIDGFRIDAVWGIQERRPEWLGELLTEIRRIKPDALVVAEASARDGFWFDADFDAAYDWTDQLGHWAWEHVFGGNIPVAEAMGEALTDGDRGYHPRALVLRFLNNNDTGPRFVTTHGDGCYRTALAMLLTLPGLPCLFTGDEVGAEFRPYETPRPIDWTDRLALRPYLKRLIALRHAHPALHSQTWTPLATEPAAPFFAYLREDDRGVSPPVLVVLNFFARDGEAVVTLPDALADRWTDAELRDLLAADAPTAGAVVATRQHPASPSSRACRGISSMHHAGENEIPRQARDEGLRVRQAAGGASLVVSVPAWGARILSDDRS